MSNLEFVCRYDVLGPPNGCKGQCEGTGLIPHAEYLQPAREGECRATAGDDPPIYRVLWFFMEGRQPAGDSYHFLPCPDCQPDDPLVRLARQFLGEGPQ